MSRLGVNIDHIATVREARKVSFPDPVTAAQICEKSGADSIVCHLREDRRHIKDADVYALKKIIKTRFNLEMSIAKDIVDIACRLSPDQATIVPEKRQEVTTEGGLNVRKNEKALKKAIKKLTKNGISVSLFVEPETETLKKCIDIGAKIVELHTGSYANSKTESERKKNIEKIESAAAFGTELGLIVNAGHGLDYKNVKAISDIEDIKELNIGYAIIARALFIGLENAVKEMKRLIE